MRNCELQTNVFDLIVLTETWFDDEVPDENLRLHNYTVIRCDRDAEATAKSRGGGVLVALNKSINSYRIVKQISLEFERLDLEITKNNCKLYLSVSYFPQLKSAVSYDEFVTNVMNTINQRNYSNFLILGDFNLPGYNWVDLNYSKQLCGHHNSNIIRDGASTLYSLIKNFQLKQINTYVNNSNNTLDLFLCNNSHSVQSVQTNDPLSIIDEHHSAQIIEYQVLAVNNKNNNKFIYNYLKGNYKEISNILQNINWSYINNTNSHVNDFLNELYNILYAAIELHVPKYKLFNSNFPNYFSNELKLTIFKKRLFHYLFKEYNLPIYYDKFNELRRTCKILQNSDYDKMINDISIKSKNDPKKFWKFINGNQYNYPKEFSYKTIISNSDNITVNLFADQFSNVYKTTQLSNYNLDHILYSQQLEDIEITTKDILNAMKSINISVSHGPDKINSLLISNCINELLNPLCILFNNIILNQMYPDELKKCYIIPVYKSGCNSEISNYRPISLINVISKIFEKIIFTKISTHLYKYIINEQHGGVPGKSTLTNLVSFNEFVSDSFSNNLDVQAIYLDISKAFDSVNHCLLLHKLSFYGIGTKLINLFKSYLCNRQLIVKFNDCLSESFIMPSGIPQGSTLATLLFILYINDIKSSITHSKFLLFIDDLKIFIDLKDNFSLLHIQDDLNKVTLWAKKNDLDFNPLKCLTMLFSKSFSVNTNQIKISDCILSTPNTVKDLGILYQCNFKFNQHIDSIILKAKRKLNYIKFVCRNFNNIQLLKNVYNANQFLIMGQ